jgi:hypothetical protein
VDGSVVLIFRQRAGEGCDGPQGPAAQQGAGTEERPYESQSLRKAHRLDASSSRGCGRRRIVLTCEAVGARCVGRVDLPAGRVAE